MQDVLTATVNAIALFTVAYTCLSFASVVARRRRAVPTAAPTTPQPIQPIAIATTPDPVQPVAPLPDPWEAPITPVAHTKPAARAVVEPAFARLLPPAKQAAQPKPINYKTLTVVQLRQVCTKHGIKWNRGGKGGKHMSKGEMIARLTA